MKYIRTYSELSRIKGFIERFEYLKLSGVVGESTFGFDRYLNQSLYRSTEWRRARDSVLIRDDGLDMGVEGYPAGDRMVIHHMNPLSARDIEDGNPDIFRVEYLVCVSFSTHNAIHYGDASLLPKPPVERTPGDTCPWR